MKTFIVLALLILATFALKKDDAFMKKYQVKILKESQYEHYPQKGDKLSVHYTGRLLSGKKFDSSVDRNQQFTFNIGQGRVIRCWEEVMANMTVGEKVVVICPADHAYGSRGFSDLIPPNSDLEFEIELFSFGKHKKTDL